MNHVKMFEEFWPFRKKPEPTPFEINQKKWKEVPQIIKNSGLGNNVLNLTITDVTVGMSQVYKKRLIVDLCDKEAHSSIRINFVVDDDLFVIGKDTSFLLVAGKIELHVIKHRLQFRAETKELKKLQDDILKLLQSKDLVKMV